MALVSEKARIDQKESLFDLKSQVRSLPLRNSRLDLRGAWPGRASGPSRRGAEGRGALRRSSRLFRQWSANTGVPGKSRLPLSLLATQLRARDIRPSRLPVQCLSTPTDNPLGTRGPVGTGLRGGVVGRRPCADCWRTSSRWRRCVLRHGQQDPRGLVPEPFPSRGALHSC